MKKNLIFLLIYITAVGTPLFAQGVIFHGKLQNSYYSFESDKIHSQLYQYLRIGLATPDDRVALNSSMRALTDPNQTLDNDERFKAYVLSVKFRKLFNNRLDLELGRQFLHPGTVLGGVDGVVGKFYLNKNISARLYGGSESRLQRSFKIDKPSKRMVAGGLVQINDVAATKVQVLYLQKSNDQSTYWQIAGVNFDNKSLPKTTIRLQSHYDLQNDRLHRLLISGNYSCTQKFAMTVGFKQQYPQIYANSFFTIFQPKAYKQYRIGGTVEIFSNYYVSAQFQRIAFEDDPANRVFVNIQNSNGSIGLLYENGYAGDQTSLMFDYAYEVFGGLTASVYVDYSKYRTEEVYEYDNQLANAARLSYRFCKRWRADAEYQWLTNRFKEKDSRFLNHISYTW